MNQISESHGKVFLHFLINRSSPSRNIYKYTKGQILLSKTWVC